MDEYTGKRVVSGLGVSRKGPGLAFRDASNHEDQSVQYCNRLGCSTRPNSFKGSRIGSPDRVKSSRPVFRSASGKAMVGSSSKTYSSVSSLRKSHQEPQKISSHKETKPAEASSMQGKTEISEFIPSTSSVQGGLPEPEDAESRVLKDFPADASEEGRSYSVTSNTRPRKQIHQRSEMCNQETSLGSSDRQSFMSRNTSQFAKPIYGQGANTSKYGLRNLGCTSVSDVLPSGCSSSVSNRSRRTDVKRRSLDGESSATSGKSMSGSSTGGSSGAPRNSFSGPSLSISERSSSQQASRRARNWLSGRDGVTSVRTRRTMNGDTSTRFSEPGNGNGYNLSPSESLGLNSQLPETEMPTSGTTPPNSIQQFPAELPSNQQNSYGRPGSSRDLCSRLIAHPEDGMTRSFHGFSIDRDGFRRFNTNAIAEVLLALERIEQDEELTYEQLLVLDTNLFLGGLSFHDQHRDMRLDIDNMSYEELLALEEKMGTVSTALTEEVLSNCLKRSCYMPEPPDSGSIDCGVDDVKCSICQEEYVAEDELGTLGCEHRYHVECIQQWLQQKNWCAICKAPAAPS